MSGGDNLNDASSIDVSQEVYDEKMVDPEQASEDPMINIQIAHVEETMSTFYCVFIVALFFSLIYLCWQLLIFVFVMYYLITGDDPSDTDSGVRRLSWARSICFCGRREAQEEDRVTHPTDDGVDAPPDTAAPLLVAVDVQNIEEIDPISRNDFTDHQHAAAGMPNEIDVAPEADEDLAQILIVSIVGLNRFLRLFLANEPQGGATTNDSSDEEDQRLSSESSNDDDDENGFLPQTQRQGEASPAYQNHSNPPQHTYTKAEQIDLAKDSSTATDKTDFHLVHDEVHDTKINVAIPSNDLLQAIASSPSTYGLISKTKLSYPLQGASSNEQTFS